MINQSASLHSLRGVDARAHNFLQPAEDALQVRRILPGEPLGDVQRLRREVYYNEQGQHEASHRISDGLDGSGTVIVVERGTQAVGTLRVHDFSSPAVQVEYGSLFQIDRFASAWPLQRVVVGSRLAVQSDQRALDVVDCLMEETYRHALEHDLRFGLVACEPSLYSLFEYYGFREYLPPAVLADGRALLRMLLVVEDEPHLRQCDSPLQHMVRNPAAGRVARNWLERSFKQAF
ncbi:MAG TPA: hypothetical protein VK325_01440 [Pseudoxanthomonas sp.]|nr:hypothetical protein [Pseudoxanthomonas sp.]